MKCTLRIESINGGILNGFKYFWLKHVVGFASSQHCAKCLKGEYVRFVSSHISTNIEYSLDSKAGEIFYLCGVSSPYIWDNNAHLAFKVKTGSVAKLKLYTGDVVRINKAQAIPFDDEAARTLFPGRSSKFLTCRNFQFGAQYFANPKNRKVENEQL